MMLCYQEVVCDAAHRSVRDDYPNDDAVSDEAHKNHGTKENGPQRYSPARHYEIMMIRGVVVEPHVVQQVAVVVVSTRGCAKLIVVNEKVLNESCPSFHCRTAPWLKNY